MQFIRALDEIATGIFSESTEVTVCYFHTSLGYM